MYVAGDFNIDPARDLQEYSALCSLLESYNLKNIVDKPTRGNHVLDHVFSTCELDKLHMCLITAFLITEQF